MSACTKNLYRRRLAGAQLQCLFNEPLQEDALSMCGNGVVDAGEECDCGTPSQCQSVCCDAATCRFKESAQCDTGPCCLKCRALSNSTLCRPAAQACDVAEYCDGVTGACPFDAHLVDGSSCADPTLPYTLVDTPNCYAGKCRSRRAQCTLLWGDTSMSADRQCYNHFNLMGVSNGHCGIEANTDKFIACQPQHAECGSLHCEGGEPVPLMEQRSVGTYVATSFSTANQTYACKSVSALPLGQVADGSSCANDTGLCLRATCVPKRDLPTLTNCPTNNVALVCSGHGACSTSGQCVCTSPFIGFDCGMRGPNVMTPTRRQPIGAINVPPLDTSSMLVILGAVAGGVMLLLLILLVCYRRRSSAKSNHVLQMISDANSTSGTGSIAQRAIKFAGNMPSYREEKRKKRKMNKMSQIHDLSKIDERSNEQDSVSLKSSSQVGSVVTAPEAPSMPPPTAPDRGILKIRPEIAPLLMGYESDAIVYSNQHGSEHLFSRSARQHCPPSPSRSDHYGHHRRSKLSAYRTAGNSTFAGYGTDTEEHLMQHRPFNCQPRAVAALCTPKHVRRHFNMNPINTDMCIDGVKTSSPTSSIASGGSSSRLAKPAPLKLRNIEYLLRQLDEQPADDLPQPDFSMLEMARLTLACVDDVNHHQTDARSSQQSSNGTDQNSHTESHRDALLLANDPSTIKNNLPIHATNVHNDSMHSFHSQELNDSNECPQNESYSYGNVPQRPNKLNLPPS